MTTDPKALIAGLEALAAHPLLQGPPDPENYPGQLFDDQICRLAAQALRDLTTENADLQRAVLMQAGKVARLKARLELDPEWGQQADGIACRDDTIKLLDERIARQDERLARLKALGDGLAEELQECANDLEAEIEARRGAVLPRTMDRDLFTVRRAHAALAAWETGDD